MAFALPARPGKPRRRGLTSVIDFGPDQMGWTGATGVRDFLACVGPHVDFAKIYAMNALLLPAGPLTDIVSAYCDGDVTPYAGGILFEYAMRTNSVDGMLDHLERVGVRALEISENYVTLRNDERRRYAEAFRARGFTVIYEFGRKNPEAPFEVDELREIVSGAIDAGAAHVIVEQSELDAVRAADGARLDELARQAWFEHVWVEADPYAFPRQHVALLDTFGLDVNLANVAAGQALRLEGFRRGIGRAVDYRLLSEGGA